ncbi:MULTISPECIES: HAD family hydrolase [Kitasatospora]|uniref:Putative phosphatase n=1 Tax=Kitasatospora setae (strain ATCC 33774 / DSM 43861 / JCM 3304 / KCC A-0304 / NBRC 14216 / KM-6054) TaxID=452652 RepID=E4N038_KITSK|nr:MULTISPECIES: HAD family hydrolase [Kitasatospora]BAJ31366.1 putative phosphatase [Kitasatospora setae KM-6054]
MPAPRPAAVLFDMDGTLVDTEHLWWQAAAELAAELDLALTDDDLPEVLGQAVEHTAAHLHRSSRTGRPEAELVARLNESFAAKVAAQVVPRPGALALLAALRAAGVPTALVSASPRRVVDLVLAAIGAHWFSTTLAAEDTPRTKPAPDPYLAAAERLGLPPARCVAVEDTPTGVASARAAGCAVLAVPSAVPIPAVAGTTVLDSLVRADLPFLAALTAA